MSTAKPIGILIQLMMALALNPTKNIEIHHPGGSDPNMENIVLSVAKKDYRRAIVRMMFMAPDSLGFG